MSLRTQRGITLVEMMASLGLLAVLVFTTTSVMEGFRKSVYRQESRLSQIQLQNEIRDVLTNTDICPNSFVNPTFDPSDDSQINLRLRNGVVVGADEANRHSKEFQTEVTDLRLTNKRHIASLPGGNNVYSSQLKLGSQSLNTQDSFSTTHLTDVYLQVNSANQIVKCWGLDATKVSSPVSCASVGGTAISPTDCRAPAGSVSIACGAGEYLQGFDTNGVKVCRPIPVRPPPVCAPELVTVGPGNGATPRVFGGFACEASCIGTYGGDITCAGGCYSGMRGWLFCGNCARRENVCRDEFGNRVN